MSTAVADRRVQVVRRFNRLYTKTIGLLPESHLDSPYSLVEVRVLYELAHRERPTAGAIAADLRLDLGYMSRIVQRFVKQGLVATRRSSADRRQIILTLTPKGRTEFRRLDRRASEDVAALLSSIPAQARERLTDAMLVIEGVLGRDATPEPAAPFELRQPEAGDLGWVVQRHGELYRDEYGWDADLEALVARIVADFVDGFDPERERGWIATLNGERVGSVFLVKKSPRVAKLRLLLVDPRARGRGLGRRLVDECSAFARGAGYHKIVLWTQSILTAARHTYVAAGYQRVQSEPHHSFGHDLVAETWELAL